MKEIVTELSGVGLVVSPPPLLLAPRCEMLS